MARATSIFYTAKSVRRQPTFSPLDKSRRTFLGAFLTLIVLTSACAVFYIGTHIQAVHLGYKISQELQKKERLIEENKRIDLEIARLKSPTRIEAEAKTALGLELPKTQQVYYLSRWDEDLTLRLAAAVPEKSPPVKEPAKQSTSTPAKSLAKVAAEKPKAAPSVKPAAPVKEPVLSAQTPAAEKKPAPSADSAKPAPTKALSARSGPAEKAKTAKREPVQPAKETAKPSAETKLAKKEDVLVARIVEKASAAEKPAKPKPGPALAYQPKEKVPAVMLDPIP